MPDTQLGLNEYLSAVQAIVQLSFDEAVWVRAEIRKLNQKNGHYYFELAEKDAKSEQVIASCKATLWKSSAQKIVAHFEAKSGIALAADLKVLIKIKARFDPQYGFSVNIEDIDPSYTLGDLALQYQNIMARLQSEALLDKNKSLPIPFDLHHILVIAPENAAALADFKKDAERLEQADLCDFEYYAATFQGKHAAQDIIQTLSSALREWAQKHNYAPDLIVLIRGGGAVNDLAYLNDYDLAALLCKRSVPIWVGIGHETDRTILDEIAHRSFDTPSKVIAGISQLINQRSQDTIQNLLRIQHCAQQHLQEYQAQNAQSIQRIQFLAQQQLQLAQVEIEHAKNTIYTSAQHQIKMAYTHIEGYFRESLLQHPKHVLNKGYTIIRQQGKIVRSAAQLSAAEIDIQFQDGHIQAQLLKESKSD